MTNPFLIFIILLLSCKGTVNPPSGAPEKLSEIYLEKIKLPEGFHIDIYAEDVTNARSMCYSPSGILYVGTRGGDKVYAITDDDKDGKADKKYLIYDNGNMPNGVAYKDGDLYVAEVNRILRFKDIDAHLDNPPTPEVIYDLYPNENHHGWKYIAFGPDGKLYVPVGAPCNICESEDPIFNTISRLDVDTKQSEIVHQGIRNSVGFTWHPETGHLWFTDNGRDWMGDDMPACELNVAKTDNQHFGYPYCHQGNLLDDEFGEGHSCDDYVSPAQNLGAHVAPLGLEFYTGDQFPSMYRNKVAFIAEHGSWNRSKKSGYVISMVTLDANYDAVSYEPFAEGWLDIETDEAWGRPVDIEFLPDGSMLVSDDFADAIYRISHSM